MNSENKHDNVNHPQEPACCNTCNYWYPEGKICGITKYPVGPWHSCTRWDKYPKEKHPDDPVNHPQHYTAGGIECIDALKAATEGLTGIRAVCAANAIKYIWRFSRKNGAEDIDKAIWYLHRLKAELAEENENRDEEDEIND